MATTNKNKITTFKSGQTIVTSEFLNSLYQSQNGETASGNEAYGHKHDGQRLDGHAQKINLEDDVDGLLSAEKIDGNIVSQISLSNTGSGVLIGDSLINPDGPSGSINIVAGNGIEIESDADNRTITFKSSADEVTYTLSSITVQGGSGVRLSSNGTNQDVLIKQGSNISVSKNLAGEIVISSLNTTYSLSGQTIAGGALIRLTDSSLLTDDLKLESGNNITIQRISADVITISATVPSVPLTTKGDLLVYGDAGNARLAAGSNGKILSANSATATGLEWTDSISFPTTTAGDLIVHNGSTNIRLPVGVNGQVLKVNTSLQEKLEWSTDQVGGDVTGPSSATNNAIVRFDLATGKLIKNSAFTIDDAGSMSGLDIKATGTLTSQTKFDYQSTLYAPATQRYGTEADLQAAINSGSGRYFVAFSDNQNSIYNIALAAPGASQARRVITISNVGLGKINLTSTGFFIAPFASNGLQAIQLKSGDWVELIAATSTNWLVVCGGTVPSYSVV